MNIDISKTELGIYLINNDIQIYNDEVISYKNHLLPYKFSNQDIDENISNIKMFISNYKNEFRSTFLDTSGDYIISVLETFSRKKKIEKLLL